VFVERTDRARGSRDLTVGVGHSVRALGCAVGDNLTAWVSPKVNGTPEPLYFD
jgi:hypothetical protein